MNRCKPRKCKGTGKAKGYGCGEHTSDHVYGLGKECKCYQNWLLSSSTGKNILKNRTLSGSKKVIQAKEKEYNKEQREKKHNNKTPRDRFYKSTAWKYCSWYVLLYYADDSGMVKCATSGVEYHVTDKNLHCGHFIKVFDSNSTNYATAFEFENMLPQSYKDNVILGGRPEEMAKQIDYIHGEGTVDYLHQKKRESYKLDPYELDKWRKHYKALFDELVKIKGNPWLNS